MDDVRNLTAKLSEAILNCSEYKDYIRYKEMIQREPHLLYLANEVRKKTYMVQNNADLSSQDAVLEIEKFKDEYRMAKSNDLVYHFLNAELCLCRMLQEINYSLIRNLDFDIDFLVDEHNNMWS